LHIPVLQKEVIEYLLPEPNENFIDCTIGGGGHTAAILKNNGPEGKVLGIEWDSELYEKLQAAKIKNQKSKIKNRLVLVNDNFANLKNIIEKYNFGPVHGILIDLGISSWHFEESKRGFSFQRDETLDMRLNPEVQEVSAKDILNSRSELEIEKILREYGEEMFARKIARNIVEQRKIEPISTTFQLLKIIKMAVPAWYCHQKINFATRTFQALRIAVNSELENLRRVLPQALDILEPDGRLVVISFHSLEDRIAKFFFREKEKEGLINILTKKTVKPTLEEIKLNPRSRSARLRAVQKRQHAKTSNLPRVLYKFFDNFISEKISD